MTKEDIITKSMHFSNVLLLDAEVFFAVQNSTVGQIKTFEAGRKLI